MKKERSKSTADEIRARLPQVTAATGAPPSGDGRSVPSIAMKQPLASQSFAVAQALMRAPLFRRGDEFVTVNEATGEILPMTAMRWRSWHQGHFVFYEGEGDKRRTLNASKDLAGCILASDEMRAHVRELRGVHLLRLPVWRGEDESGIIELLPPGYDEPTKTFTVPKLKYDEDWPLEEAREWFFTTFGEFCFAENGELFTRRSFGAFVAAMLGVFAVNLLPASAVRPLVPVIGNQPGVGKSKLVRAMLAPVHGVVAESSKPKSDDEMRKVLDASALAAKSYVFLDDVHNLASNDLNHFVSSPTHEARVMGQGILKVCANTWQVFATGNWLKSSEDIQRRTLAIFLIAPGKAADRVIAREMTDTWLFSPAYRAPACAALWAMLRNWRDGGKLRCEEARQSSFEHYAFLVGSVIVAAGIANPFARFDWPLGGDEAGRALENAVCRAAADADEGDELTADEILERLRTDGTLEVVIPSAKNDMGQKQSLGHKLARLRGREFTDTRGRRFEFGHREAGPGARYVLRFLPTNAPE